MFGTVAELLLFFTALGGIGTAVGVVGSHFAQGVGKQQHRRRVRAVLVVPSALADPSR